MQASFGTSNAGPLVIHPFCSLCSPQPYPQVGESPVGEPALAITHPFPSNNQQRRNNEAVSTMILTCEAYGALLWTCLMSVQRQTIGGLQVKGELSLTSAGGLGCSV